MLLYSLLHLTGYGLDARGAEAVPAVGLADARPPRVRPDARASRPRPGRSARASRTRSAWPSPSGASRASSTGRATTSSTTGRTSSRPTATSRRASPPRPRASPATSASASSLVLYDDNHIQLDGPTDDGLVGGRPRALRRVRLGHAAGSRTATTSRRSRRRSRRRDADDRADAHRGPDPHRLRRAEQAGHPEGPRLAARRGRGPARQGGLRLGSRRALSTSRRGARAHAERPCRRARSWSTSGRRATTRTRDAYPDEAAELRRRIAGELRRDGWDAGAARPSRRARSWPRARRARTRSRRSRGPRAGAVRRLGGPVRIEPDGHQGRGRLRGRTSRGGTCGSAFASTRWAASRTASRITAGSSPTPARS